MITLTKDLNKAEFVTHARNFHADDVFSTVFLEKLYGNITVIRLKDYKDDGTKIAYDIGLGKFDHHGRDFNELRPNGIHYCGFGLLWREFGLDYLKKINVPEPVITFEVFDNLLVNSIDAIDNGEFSIDSDYNIYTLSSLITLFRPKFDENKDEDECFLEAVEFASHVFDLILKETLSKVKAISIVKEKASEINNGVLILNENIPYDYALFFLKIDHLINFVIYPSNREGYAAHTVASTYKGMKPKIPFKKEWAGLRDYELQVVTGVKTARFCHNNLFLVTADTLEDTIELVNLANSLTFTNDK